MGQLYLMVGIPGSGKSTFINRILDPEEDVHISRDDVRFSIIHDKDQYFSREGEVFREFIKRIKKAEAEGKNVYIDATHISRGSRYKLLSALNKRPEDFVVMMMTTPFDVCMERNAARSGKKRVPDNSMHSMKNNYQAPALREGWKRIIAIDKDGKMAEVVR